MVRVRVRVRVVALRCVALGFTVCRARVKLTAQGFQLMMQGRRVTGQEVVIGLIGLHRRP